MEDGPMRRRVRARMQARAGLQVPTGIEPDLLVVGGMSRSYVVAASPYPRAPLLVVLHGAGGTGTGMASLTGLHARGVDAGFTVVLPDGEGRVWNDNRGAPRLRRRTGVDDVAFLQDLIAHLTVLGVADPGRVALIGISNGAMMAEHVVRHGLISAGALVLVAGGSSAASRAARPRPARPTSVLLFEGTADPLVPYDGGPIGRFSRLAGTRDSRGGAALDQGRRGNAVAAEQVAADWVAANGLPPEASVDQPATIRDLPVTRMQWAAPAHPSVTLYRIEGGGHTWPGGPQYLPPRLVGAVAHSLDATGIALEFIAAAL
jgi:polyhydroxybutyrate depolymerase